MSNEWKYPVLVEGRAVLFENSLARINICGRKRMNEIVNLLETDRTFVSGIFEYNGEKIGTLCEYNRFVDKEDYYIISLRTVSRVKVIDVIKADNLFDIDYVVVEPYPYFPGELDNKSLKLINSINSTISVFSKKKETSSLYSGVADLTASNIWEWVNAYADLIKSDTPEILFGTEDDNERIQAIRVALDSREIQYSVEKELEREVNESINKDQREYFLREQLKVVNKMLYGETTNDEYRAKIEKLNAPEYVKEKLNGELNKVIGMQSGTPEAYVSRNYIDTVCALPWGVYSKENNSLANARKVLDEDHYGIEDVKERIMEFLAIHKLVSNKKGNILCFYGPPGTGKTSVVKSIARALNRKYVRLSLGGVHDEAEIRGHRRTYIGALAGKIITSIRDAGTMNPVFLMDEVDKLSSDLKGDPASALLEVLDPEQNKAFVDNFIDMPFDLSEVLFITTANDISTVKKPLLDRMELIEMGSYTAEEKEEIAIRHLIPKQIAEHGIPENILTFDREAVGFIIDRYTREAGVRRLEQVIAKVCRKVAVKFGDSGFEPYNITKDIALELLGTPKVPDDVKRCDEVGVITGLAYTEYGGCTLDMECVLTNGKGNLILTGSLGDVMKESAQEALTYVKAHQEEYGIDSSLFSKDIHVNATEGAVPKDGPSAGIALTTLILSAFTGRKIRSDIALTGEITLSGRVLPIGGVKEKTMGAIRYGINKIILPLANKRDADELPQSVKDKVEFTFVERVNEVFEVMLYENN